MERSHASPFKVISFMQVLKKVSMVINHYVGTVIVFNMLNGTFIK